MAYYQIKASAPTKPDNTQDELSLHELEQVTGGGIRVPDKSPKGSFSRGISQSIIVQKSGQDKSIIAVL